MGGMFKVNIFLCMFVLTSALYAFESDEVQGRDYMLSCMEVDSNETLNLRDSLIKSDSFLNIETYEKNYFLPFAYSKDKPPRVSSVLPAGQNEPFENSQYEKNLEAVFQFSIKLQVLYDTLGFNEFIYLAYTHKSWWQVYSDSSPFRETNYRPELYMHVPAARNFENKIGLKALKFGLVHESNGEEGYTSRSWNRIYLTGLWQWENLFAQTRVWYRIPEGDKPDGYFDGSSDPYDPNADGDGNPNIEGYLGYGDIKLNYLYHRSQIGVLFRNNLRLDGNNRGAVEVSYMHPIGNSKKVFWYAEFFNGYGDSLIDYDREVTRVSFGFAFSRGLF